MSVLRQRLIEDLLVRNYSPRTVEAYVAAVAKLTRHGKRSPDHLTREDVRSFQLSLLAQQASWSQFNRSLLDMVALPREVRHERHRPTSPE